MEASTTIKNKKLSFLKQGTSMPLHTSKKIINEYQLYQRIATEKIIYQISCEQLDVKDQKFFQYKKAVVKDSNSTIKIQTVGKKLYSLLKQKTCYKLEHLIITPNTSEQHLWLKSPNITLDVAETLPSCENKVLLLIFFSRRDWYFK